MTLLYKLQRKEKREKLENLLRISSICFFVGFVLFIYASHEGLLDFRKGYRIILVDVVRDEGLVKLEVYSRDSGRAVVEVRLSKKNGGSTRYVASGKKAIPFEQGETKQITIPIDTGGKTVTYHYLNIFINGERIHWKEK